jgi:hypothetical protein
MKPRTEKSFVHVDIAESGYEPLIEEQRFHRRFPGSEDPG